MTTAIARPASTAVSERINQMAAACGGLLRPCDVVEEARSKDSVLHQCFEWNDKIAGDNYRLAQARQLIRIVVTNYEEESIGVVRTFVSLTPDRKEGGGYRIVTSVLKDPELRKQMLEDAMRDLEVFQRKYEKLTELAGVLKSIKKLTKIHR